MSESNTKMEYEKAIDFILAMIKNGELSVGSKLPTERVIADTLHIGRNSTREALSILHGMGMVHRIQGSGNYISENANDTIRQMLGVMLALGTITKRDICEFRRTMEKAACMMILDKGISTDCEERFRQILKGMKTASGEEQARLDKDFHILLMESSDNALLSTIMSAVMTVYREWIDMVLQKAGSQEKESLQKCHEGIFQGILERKTEDVNACIEEHYNIIEELILPEGSRTFPAGSS